MEQPTGWNWQDRAEGAIPRGTALDPSIEPVDGIRAYPTAYLPARLLITIDKDHEAYDREIRALRDAADSFGWALQVEQPEGRRVHSGELLPGVPDFVRAHLVTSDEPQRGEASVAPDAWRVLQRARRLTRSPMPRTSLEHVLSIDPVGLNPFSRTNPFSRSNPFSRTNPVRGAGGSEDYLEPGRGARQPVTWVGPAPARSSTPKRGRRPVVAVLDTGCGVHDWLPDGIVTRGIELDGIPVGLIDDADPERYPDLYGQLDGEIDAVAGHGTFIAGIIRQAAPDADILSIRMAGALGVIDESTFLRTVADVVELLRRHRENPKTGHPIDVLNLSLGYYHETPTDGLFSGTLHALLTTARDLGCVVVCSAGNDAIDRPSFPASLWAWPGADNGIPTDTGAPHVSVGALNPAARSVALFSNVGPWVHAYAPGAAVVSTSPGFTGGQQAATRADFDGIHRETLDPDDYRGGFAVWSGTSFSAPYVAGRIAAQLGTVPLEGVGADAANEAVAEVLKSLPTPTV